MRRHAWPAVCRFARCAALGVFARCAALSVAGLLVHPAASHTPLHAQTVLGTAVDAADGRPIGGAFVLLETEEGEERARGLTTADGTFRLATARPGAYRLRLERIGFEDLVTEPFRLEAGERISRRLEADVRPVELSTVDVRGGEPRCGTPADEALELGRVWEEARKALEGAAWTDRQSYYRFDVLLFRQELDPDGRPVTEPEHESIRVYGRHPFVSALPSDLAYGGWVRREGQGLKFYAPDAEVMLSDSFLGLHCF
ncbi:MAG: carboxypeptidase-like regulatory domain-containing protein, partial [Gemmatimonadota bacterium]